jgi:CRP/FNR family transcriptional regulator, cyclic AMP receptor protein
MREESNCQNFAPSPEGFLGELSPNALQAFEAIKLSMTYPVGSVLFIEGDAPQGVFVIAKGRVKLSLASENGKVMILRMVKAGEILGLHGVISNVGFQATAETVEPCQVNFVKREDFLRYLREQPQAALLAAKQLSESYQETCEQLRAIGLSSSAREKVAKFLLDWSESGERRKEGVRVRFTLTHEEIGQLVGASRETITRVLSDFKERQWIIIRGSVLLLRDTAALEGVVNHETLPSPALRRSRTTIREFARPFHPAATRSFIHATA